MSFPPRTTKGTVSNVVTPVSRSVGNCSLNCSKTQTTKLVWCYGNMLVRYNRLVMGCQHHGINAYIRRAYSRCCKPCEGIRKPCPCVSLTARVSRSGEGRAYQGRSPCSAGFSLFISDLWALAPSPRCKWIHLKGNASVFDQLPCFQASRVLMYGYTGVVCCNCPLVEVE